MKTLKLKKSLIVLEMSLVAFILVLSFVPTVLFNGNAFAATTSTEYPHSTGNVNGTGLSGDWQHDGRITADDTDYATNNINKETSSRYLTGTHYDLNIPSTATINGIEVGIGRKASDSNVKDNVVSLTKNGTSVTGDNKAVKGTDWPTSSITAKEYGGDLWGTTWTASEINSNNFGVFLSVRNADDDHSRTASVDYITIKIIYTTDTTPPVLTLPANITADATSPSGAIVTYSATADDTNPTHPTVSCNPTSGSLFAMGQTTVNCSATDAGGRTSTGSFKITVQDTTPPIATVSYNITAPTNQNVTATITPSETVTVTNNGGSKSYTFTANGSFTFQFKDASNNPGNATATVNWIDKINPTGATAIDNAYYGPNTYILGVIKGTASDANGIIAPVKIQIEKLGNWWNGTAWVSTPQLTVDATGTTSWSYTNISASDFTNGVIYTVTPAILTDGVGNHDYGTADSFIWDSSAPVFASTPDITKDNDSGQAGATVTFAPIATDAYSGLESIACSPLSGTIFPLGDTDVNCHAYDKVNNMSEVTFKVTVNDAEHPSQPGTPATSSPTANTKPTWAWTGSTDNAPGLHYVLFWDTTAGGETNSSGNIGTNLSFTHTTDLAGGNWFTKVRTYDASGNYTDSSNGNVLVDTVAPSTIANTGVYTFGNWSKDNVDVTLTATDVGGAGIYETYWCYDNGSVACIPNETGLNSNGVYTAPLTFDTEGQWKLRYYSMDNAGNIESPQTKDIKIDKTAPTNIEITAPQNSDKLKGTYVISANTSGDLSGIDRVEFYYQSTPTLIGTDNDSSDGYSVIWDTTGLIDGVHQVKAVSYDFANNSQVSALVDITVDNTKPIIYLTGSDVTITVGSGYTDQGATAKDNIDGNITENIVKTGLVNTGIVGTYTITYNVTDSSGNVAYPVSRVVTVSPAPVGSTTQTTSPRLFSRALGLAIAGGTASEDTTDPVTGVLGTETSKPNDNQINEVLGTAITKVASTKSWLGFAWYWWLLAIVVVGILILYFLLKKRRNNEEE